MLGQMLGLLGGAGLLHLMSWNARLTDMLRLQQGASLAILDRRAGFGGRKGRAARRRLRRLEAFFRGWERTSARLRHAAYRATIAPRGSPLRIESQITTLATIPWMRTYLGWSTPSWLREEAVRSPDPFWGNRTTEALFRQETRRCVGLTLATLTTGTRFVHPSEVSAWNKIG